MKLQPPSTLIMGAPGCGKTTSLLSYIEAGLDLFVISTEPGGVESLLDGIKERKLDINKLHYMTVMPTTSGWDALDEMTKSIGVMDFEALSKLKGVGKNQTRIAAMNFLNALKDFQCERDGKSYGDFMSRTDQQALAIDSFSGLSTMGWYLTVGYKPTGAPGEWNIAQNWLSAVLLKINSDRNCFFTLTAHVEKEPNEITGVNQISVSTLGKKLAPKIPQYFGDVVYATKTTAKGFKWATIDNNADLKNRALPNAVDLAPSFVPIVEAYRRRKQQATGMVAPVSPAPASATS